MTVRMGPSANTSAATDVCAYSCSLFLIETKHVLGAADCVRVTPGGMTEERR